MKGAQRKLKAKDMITPRVFRWMTLVGLPAPFILACTAYLVRHGRVQPGSLDAVEYYAGAKTWASELRQAGYRVATFELKDGEDILTDEGFLTALALLLSLAPGGVGHWAVVCSSWVQVNHGRQPAGQRRPPLCCRVRC